MADSILAGRGDDQYMLRFPVGLREEIKQAAQANGRSMNSEIIARIVGDVETLRDKFAGQAISGVIRQCAQDLSFNLDIAPADYFAKKAFEIADAMIAARKGGA